MIEYNFDLPCESVYKNKNIIYGAGANGKFLNELLKSKDIIVEAFYDDDRCRWGDEYCGKKYCLKRNY